MKIKTAIMLGLVFGPAALNAQKTIVLTKAPVVVPNGKKWLLQANTNLLVELTNGTLKSGTMCNAFILSNPSFLGAIYQGEWGRPTEAYTLILKDYTKQPYANDYTYNVRAQAIVDDKFNFEELAKRKANEVGKPVVEFWEGSSLYAGNCLVGIQLLEFPITQEDRLRAGRKAENMSFEIIKAIKSPQQLYQKIGKENVVVRNYAGLEDDFRNGKEYILYPNTPNEIAVSFEKRYFRFYKENAIWDLPKGIKVGQGISDVELVNGKKFYVFGFEWDYAGLVSNWDKGNLEDKVIATFSPRNEIEYEQYQNIIGEKEIISSDETLNAVQPAITEIVIKM